MKKSFNSLFVHLSNSSLQNLTSEVKEIISYDCNKPNTKTFTTADLWNIHRQAKSRVQRRFL